MVPVKVPASAVAVMIISALPSNATPLIFFVAANLVAVAALPVEFNFKSNAVCVAVETGLFASLVLSTLPNPKFVLAPAAVVAPVPPLAMAIEVPLQVPLVIVPTVVKLLVPAQELIATFSTLLNPTLDLLIPVASLASVTAPSANLIVVMPPSATPPPLAFAVT